MTFKPAPFAAVRRGLLTLAALALGEGLLLALLAVLPVGGLAFFVVMVALGWLALIVYLAWRAWGCLSLQYWIDRNAVMVAWGPLRQVIPLAAIQAVQQGGCVEASAHWLDRWPRLASWVLFGPYLNLQCRLRLAQPGVDAPHRSTGPLLCLASQPVEQQLILVTEHGAFGITPQDPEAFIQALEAHHALGPTRLLAVRRIRPSWAEAKLWQDGWGLGLLAAGLVGSLLLLGTVMLRFPTLPPNLTALDGAAVETLFLAPAFGLAVWVINGLWGLLLYARQRVAALLLWAGALIVQLAVLAALLSVKG